MTRETRWSSPGTVVGIWSFVRTIDERSTGAQSTAHGRTTLAPTSRRQIRWSESGTLVTAGARLPTVRTLFIIREDEQWIVTFDDGRPFHLWTPGAVVTHSCGRDLYRGRIDIDHPLDHLVHPQRWTVSWDVTGPRKNYTSTTVLTPTPDDQTGAR